jgi:hypothetical protein
MPLNTRPCQCLGGLAVCMPLADAAQTGLPLQSAWVIERKMPWCSGRYAGVRRRTSLATAVSGSLEGTASAPPPRPVLYSISPRIARPGRGYRFLLIGRWKAADGFRAWQLGITLLHRTLSPFTHRQTETSRCNQSYATPPHSVHHNCRSCTPDKAAARCRLSTGCSQA